MNEGNHTPDTPYRSGISGKYKLLIKSVTQKYSDFEYELSDAEGKEYTARSKEHYAEGSLLRCMVSFRIENARLVAYETAICKKQDLTVPISVQPAVKPKAPKLPPPSPLFLEGEPATTEKTGAYKLTVETILRWYGDGATKFLCVLKGETAQRYYVASNERYSAGKELICQVEVIKEHKGNYYFSKIIGDETSKPVGKVDGEVIPRHHFLASPSSKRKPHTTPAPKKKKTTDSIVQAILFDKYEKRERYNFIVTNERDQFGNQILEDDSGRIHLLTGTDNRYQAGEKVRCTVKGFGNKPVGPIQGPYLVLSEPRRVSIERITVSVPYVKSPSRWHSEVQGLGKHKCGKAFKCSCCGRNFPANAGWRVDLKDIYFCNSCARQIYEPEGRGNHRFYISTPMGNKR